MADQEVQETQENQNGQNANSGYRRKNHTKAPPTFNGKDYKKFICACTLFMDSNWRDFDDDDSKIHFILSYMTEGLAEKWAENFVDENLGAFSTWANFAACLRSSFEDKNERRQGTGPPGRFKTAHPDS